MLGEGARGEGAGPCGGPGRLDQLRADGAEATVSLSCARASVQIHGKY